MIISASRRTDIPAFYAEWLMARVRVGSCQVVNPFNRQQISEISLKPEDVEAIVFWTRNPRPMLAHLDELDALGHRSVFQVTLMDNPRLIDRYTPHLGVAIEAFHRLSRRLGAASVIWRYDPILLSNLTTLNWHLETFERIAAALKGYTSRSVVSLYDPYRAAERRLVGLADQGLRIEKHELLTPARLASLWRGIAQIAKANGMTVQSCAEPEDLGAYGIQSGACIDGPYLERTLGIALSGTKDPNQRPHCRCAPSKDIGAYDTCLYGCQYCYATHSAARALANYRRHDSSLPYLLA